MDRYPTVLIRALSARYDVRDDALGDLFLLGLDLPSALTLPLA